MTADPLHIDRATWNALDAQQRKLLGSTGMSIEEKLRRGQRLSAQAASLRRALGHGELPVDPLPGLDSGSES